MMMKVKMEKKKKRALTFTACLLAAMLCACSQEPAGQTGQTPAATEADALPESAAENAETASAQSEAPSEIAETASSQREAAVSSEAAESAETAEPETLSVSILEGTFNGWADNHTVEITVDGVPTAFQVEDEEVKAALEAVSEGTALSFAMEQDGEVRRIVEVQ